MRTEQRKHSVEQQEMGSGNRKTLSGFGSGEVCVHVLIASHVDGRSPPRLDPAVARNLNCKVLDLDPIPLGILDLEVRLELEKFIEGLAESEPGWEGQTLDTVALYPADFSGVSGQPVDDQDSACGPGGRQQRAMPAEDLDDALSKDIDAAACDRLESRIRNRIRMSEDEMSWLWAFWGHDPSTDLMSRIGNYFVRAGDYLRLGILSQKRSR